MKIMAKIKRFEKEFALIFKSKEDVNYIRTKCLLNAEASLDLEIARIKYEKTMAANKLELAKEEYHKAKYSELWITDQKAAMQSIDSAKVRLENAEKDVKNLEYSLNVRQSLLAEYTEEIEA